MCIRDRASVDDQLYGFFLKGAVKSFIWYSPPAFEAAGYEVPETWDELQALEQQIIDDGAAPWCIGLEAGAATGWPCLLYTSPSPRDRTRSRMPSSA